MKPITVGMATCIMIGTLSVVALPALLFGAKIQTLFLIAWFAVVFVLVRLGYPFQRLQKGAASAWSRAFSPVLFLLCAGAMVGAWNVSGTLPALTIFGVSFVNGTVFPLASFLCCFLFGFMTGTVFGTLGTMGLILLVVGKSLHLSVNLVLAALLSGSFLGYGISPLADCTNLVASALELPLAQVMGSQRKIVFPIAAICTAGFSVAGFLLHGAAAGSAESAALVAEIRSAFRVGLVPYAPIVLVVLMLYKRLPALLAIAAGTAAGAAIAVSYQGVGVSEVVSALWNGPVYPETAVEMQAYFGGGGMKSMADTVILFLLAFSLFGVLEECGVIRLVAAPLLSKADSRLKATGLTVLLGFVLNILSASGMCSFIFTLSCLAPVYEEKGWSKGDLCTASFVGCLYLSLLIPWHSNVATPSALLGVTGGLLQRAQVIPYLAVALLFLLQGLSLDRKILSAAKLVRRRSGGGK